MEKYLVLYAHNSGIAELSNAGLFDGKDKQEAKEKAKKQWNTTADLFVININDLPDGWSYYT